MRLSTTSPLLAVLLTLTLHGQVFSFGEPFALTNTRYGTTAAEPRLRSDGESLYAYWRSETDIRMTRIVEGARRGGLPVITTSQNGFVRDFDAVWNGTNFVVVATLPNSNG